MEIDGLAGVVEDSGSYELNTSSSTFCIQNGIVQTWAFLIVAGACTGWFFCWQGNRVRGGQRGLMPPGPLSWPIVGSLVHIMASGLPIHETLAKLAETYGPVMFFYLGSLPCLVVSSAEAAEVVLKDSNFAHRATETLLYTCRHLDFDNQGFLEHYNQRVKLLRKLCATELMTTRRIAAFAKERMEDIQATVLNVARISQGGKHLVNVQDALGHQGLNIMTKMILGRRLYGADDEAAQVLQEFSEILPHVLQLAGTFYWGDLFPALRWLDVNGRAKNYRKRRLQMEKAYRAIINEVENKLVNEDIEGDRGSDSASFVEVLLSQQKENNISDTTIMATITDLIIGGTEAFGTVAEWAIIELVRKPEKMERLQEEIDSVVGRSRLVEESDFAKLPYFRACVREALRLYPSLPLLLPRETEGPTTMNGYYIPPKTVVLVNAWQIARDHACYDNPHAFEPERFLGSEGVVADYHFLAFGGGRRGCVGGRLGLVMLQLTLASLVHAYHWAPPLGIEPQDLEVAPTLSMVLTPRLPIYFRTAPRLQLDVYGMPSQQLE